MHTVQWAGLKGMKNGALLAAAEHLGYQVILTGDQGIPYQNRLAGRHLAMVVVSARTNQLEDLLPMVPAITRAMAIILPGEVAPVRG